MKFSSIKLLPIICVFLGLSVSHLSAAADNAVAGGILVNPIGSIKSISYERMVMPGFSVGGRLNSIGYDTSDGSYEESGSGSGVEVMASYHFNRNGFSGPYISVALGQADVDWNWYDYYATPRSGEGNSKLTSYTATFGWDFVMGSGNFTLRPSVMVGSYSGAGTDNTGTKTSKIGAVAGVGVAGMFAF
ncbi:MAG: hypothetical protein KKH12_03235 [Gammaproteobacteria bacterium]|nr:hypothetical protein [Gammaproteobacteria bacterium]MBU1480669.1 hypothetical protein [Gammaproteobacteria bacterium]